MALVVGTILVGGGCAYINVSGPYDADIDNTGFGTKVGRSSNHSILWLVAWGDGGYKAAADNGDIAVMKHADFQYTQYLMGLYARQTTIVYGD